MEEEKNLKLGQRDCRNTVIVFIKNFNEMK